MYETTTIHTSSWRSFSLIKKTADRINERVTAVGAGVGLLAAVDAQVDDEPLLDGEGLAADLARERLDARVARQVRLERPHLCEGLVAHVAFERTLAPAAANFFVRTNQRNLHLSLFLLFTSSWVRPITDTYWPYSSL